MVRNSNTGTECSTTHNHFLLDSMFMEDRYEDDSIVLQSFSIDMIQVRCK